MDSPFLARIHQKENIGLNRKGARDIPSIEGMSISQTEAAKLLNVGVASVERAAVVLKKDDEGNHLVVPELIAAVDRGDIAVSQAAKAAKLEPEFQHKVIEAIEAGRT